MATATRVQARPLGSATLTECWACAQAPDARQDATVEKLERQAGSERFQSAPQMSSGDNHFS
eukprot:915748-Prymnesium_polylepis.1